MPRQSQAIAMTLRFLLYASEPGATYNTYPNGSSTTPVLVPYTEKEQAEWGEERDRALAEWERSDPEGLLSWKVATARMQMGDLSSLADGWSAMMLEHGVQIVDPCAHCWECRSRR